MKCDPTSSIGFWHPAANSGPGPGYYPYVAYNTTKQPQVGCKGWAVRPGEIAMEGSTNGQYSLVRFTAPVAGTYKVSAQFEGHPLRTIYDRRACAAQSDVAIRRRYRRLRRRPAFHKVEGQARPRTMEGRLN